MNKNHSKKILFVLIKAFFLVLWIIWTIFFPLFIDTTLYQEGNLSGIPILNPFYGLSILVSAILCYLFFKELKSLIKGKKKDANEN
ncbi:MAG: hypothetical protein ACTSP3_05925 [Candidatus Heimdallarchaeaceae archaeon]